MVTLRSGLLRRDRSLSHWLLIALKWRIMAEWPVFADSSAVTKVLRHAILKELGESGARCAMVQYQWSTPEDETNELGEAIRLSLRRMSC